MSLIQFRSRCNRVTKTINEMAVVAEEVEVDGGEATMIDQDQ